MKPLEAITATPTIKVCHKFTKQGDYKNVAPKLRNSKMFKIWSKSFNL